MDPRPVAVIDSGIGGLPYLAWLQQHLSEERFVYVADRKSFPYGEKTPDEVRTSVTELTSRLVRDYDPKLLVVACNTASVLALAHLRQRFPGPVVGVVPAVKSAAALTKNGRIGVLATQRTIEGGYLADLIERFCPGRVVKSWAASDIVTLVENDFGRPDPSERKRILQGWVDTVNREGTDTVVLGCTHFLHVSSELSALFGAGVTLVDNREGVGRRVETLLSEKKAHGENTGGASVFHFTARNDWTAEQMTEQETKYRHFARRFDLLYAGPWTDLP